MIKFLTACLSFFMFTGLANAQVKESPAAFNFTQVNVSQVINLIYSEVLKSDYVIDPEVLNDQRMVSFRLQKSVGSVKAFTSSFLKSLGYSVHTVKEVDYIAKTKDAEIVQPLEDIKIYQPRYREASYLSRLLQPLFKGRFTTSKGLSAPPGSAVTQNVPATSAAGAIEQEADVLIFSGQRREVDLLTKVLSQVDKQKGEVSVKAVIYEVSSTKADGSAFNALVKILNGKIGISINTASKDLGNSIKVSLGGIDALLSVLSTDQRFKLLSQPQLRVRSGEAAKIVVGQDVPTLGAVSYQQGGNAVQSVQYQSAGTILSILPTVFNDSVDLHVSQQLSNFVTTTTGVSASPTLIKRSIETSVSAAYGDIIVLGGLTETKSTNASSGFSFTNWKFSKLQDDATVDVIVILQIEKT